MGCITSNINNKIDNLYNVLNTIDDKFDLLNETIMNNQRRFNNKVSDLYNDVDSTNEKTNLLNKTIVDHQINFDDFSNQIELLNGTMVNHQIKFDDFSNQIELLNETVSNYQKKFDELSNQLEFMNTTMNNNTFEINKQKNELISFIQDRLLKIEYLINVLNKYYPKQSNQFNGDPWSRYGFGNKMPNIGWIIHTRYHSKYMRDIRFDEYMISVFLKYFSNSIYSDVFQYEGEFVDPNPNANNRFDRNNDNAIIKHFIFNETKKHIHEGLDFTPVYLESDEIDILKSLKHKINIIFLMYETDIKNKYPQFEYK